MTGFVPESLIFSNLQFFRLLVLLLCSISRLYVYLRMRMSPSNNSAGVPSNRATFGFPQYCDSTCARSGCTRHAICVDCKPTKNYWEKQESKKLYTAWKKNNLFAMDMKSHPSDHPEAVDKMTRPDNVHKPPWDAGGAKRYMLQLYMRLVISDRGLELWRDFDPQSDSTWVPFDWLVEGLNDQPKKRTSKFHFHHQFGWLVSPCTYHLKSNRVEFDREPNSHQSNIGFVWMGGVWVKQNIFFPSALIWKRWNTVHLRSKGRTVETWLL